MRARLRLPTDGLIWISGVTATLGFGIARFRHERSEWQSR